MKRTPVLLAMLVAAAMAVQPLPVKAQVVEADAEVEGFNSREFFDYSICAVSIGFAVGTGAWLLAGLACGKALADHWDT